MLSVRSISMPPPWLSLLLVSEWAVSFLKCFLTGRNEGKEHDQQNHILGECLRGWWCIVVFELKWLRIVRFLTERTLYGTLMVDICHYTFVQTHRMNIPLAVNPDVNYRLWVIMTCQCRLINGNKSTIVVQNVLNRGDTGKDRGIWRLSIPSPQLCCEPKTTLEK